MSRPKITAIVQTYNAAEHLDICLTALKRFDEILVVDMESTDDTVAIAERHGARVIVKERGPHRIVEAYRDFAIKAATNDWVLVVDADEIVTPALAAFLYTQIRARQLAKGIPHSYQELLYGHVDALLLPRLYTALLQPRRCSLALRDSLAPLA